MKTVFCPYCGKPVHEEAVIPPTATCPADIWVLWFCDGCKWVSDWPGMPKLPGELGKLGAPIGDPAALRGRCGAIKEPRTGGHR